ncbi:unnamed protein product [Dibothriocephalus latus]|uniref:Helicase ATP-binding domain-containing protein n=1 Tax=Dibothriocephalus latus TaxID=60516 RepID=A0A3P7NW04_DIBLA|nr:unnamed protein product [Dibothriocephalus latus]
MASEVRLLANLLRLLYILHTNNSWVISAPTGSGKTGLLELALCKLLSDVKKLQSNTLPKAIYPLNFCSIHVECLSRGVGFHHAGLSLTDRYLVEQAFVAGQLPVLGRSVFTLT